MWIYKTDTDSLLTAFSIPRWMKEREILWENN